MNRRSFLQRFGAGAAVAAAPAADAAAKAALADQDRVEFRGRVYHWLGWKQRGDSDTFWSAWVTLDDDQSGYYSTTGGVLRWYMVGYQFNLIQRESVSPFVTMQTSDAEKRRQRHAALARLITAMETSETRAALKEY